MTDQTSTDLIQDDDFLFDPEQDVLNFVELGDNEWGQYDEEHIGELWFTQEHQDKFGCGEEEIDWELRRNKNGELDKDDQEYFDKGCKWRLGVVFIGRVVNKKGQEVRLGEYQDVLKANGLDTEALEAEGCEEIVWGAG